MKLLQGRICAGWVAFTPSPSHNTLCSGWRKTQRKDPTSRFNPQDPQGDGGTRTRKRLIAVHQFSKLAPYRSATSPKSVRWESNPQPQRLQRCTSPLGLERKSDNTKGRKMREGFEPLSPKRSRRGSNPPTLVRQTSSTPCAFYSKSGMRESNPLNLAGNQMPHRSANSAALSVRLRAQNLMNF